MVFQAFNGVIDTIMSPIMILPPLPAIIVISFCISLMITLIYKFTTDQKLMKDLKDEIKELQSQLKELKEDPEKMMQVQKKAMETNMKYMMHSMRPTLFTFLPIILIFGWLAGTFSAMPLSPGDQFDVIASFDDKTGSMAIQVPKGLDLVGENIVPITDNKATWTIKSNNPGKFSLGFEYKNNTYRKEVLITEQQDYIDPTKSIDVNGLNDISVVHEKLIVLNLFGWKLGWLGAYIIFSIIFSMTLRKLLKIY